MNQALAKTQNNSGLAAVEQGDFGRNAVARMNMRELKQVAEVFLESGSFSDVKGAAQAMVKIMAGAELGFSPIVSMTGVHFFNGKVSIGANLIASLIKDGGKYEYKITEHTDQACTIQFFQKIVINQGEGKPPSVELKSLGVAVSYTWADASKAGLTGKDNWKKYPKDMLFAAAIRQGARRYCADILRGITPDAGDDNNEDTVDRSAMDKAEARDTTTVNGETVDTRTGEVIDAEIIEPAPDMNHPDPAVEPKAPTDETTAASTLLDDINELFKLKCGDGEAIDEAEAAKVLGTRDMTMLNTAGLEKLRDELAAM